jgi:hypothetical protein
VPERGGGGAALEWDEGVQGKDGFRSWAARPPLTKLTD